MAAVDIALENLKPQRPLRKSAENAEIPGLPADACPEGQAPSPFITAGVDGEPPVPGMTTRPATEVVYNAGGVKVRDVIKALALEEDGWRLARTKGSHRQFHHPTKPGTVTVAGHGSVDIPPGTLNNILKQAGLK